MLAATSLRTIPMQALTGVYGYSSSGEHLGPSNPHNNETNRSTPWGPDLAWLSPPNTADISFNSMDSHLLSDQISAQVDIWTDRPESIRGWAIG